MASDLAITMPNTIPSNKNFKNFIVNRLFQLVILLTYYKMNGIIKCVIKSPPIKNPMTAIKEGN